jgi:acetyltransferase
VFNYIFNPKSVALIGASRDRSSLGYDILENVKKLGFVGKIYPVNLNAKKILGLDCYKSVLDIKSEVDLAVIMVPAKFVNQVVKECGQKGIKGVVVISAGFKETGAQGLKREQELQAIAKKYHIRVIGPNCLGIINPHINLNASFADGMPKRGNVGLISQSGAMAVAILDWAYQSKVGFSKIISIGNKAGLTEIDLMRYLSSDPATKVIIMYLESISNGSEFMKLADRITNNKPIIALKAGTSKEGTKAISSHTGSLAGSDQTIETAMRQCGVIRARTIEDLFDYAKAFSWLPLPRNNRVAIVTNAGGPGIMATDTMARTQLKLAELSNKTKKYLRRRLPATASVENPIDIIGDALADRYQITMEAVLADSNVDAVVVILTPQTMTEEKETAELIAELVKKSKKPILPVFMGGENVNKGRLVLQGMHVPNFEFCERAVRTLDKMYVAHRIKTDVVLPKYFIKNKKLNFALNKPQLKTLDCEKILAAYDIPFLKNRLVVMQKDLSHITEWPIAMKIASRDIVHKKSSGGVIVDVPNKSQAEKAYQKIIHNIKKYNNHAEIDGILVQPMARQGKEIIIGMKRDANFLPIIMFGLGGSYVEAVRDVSFRIAPYLRRDAVKQIKEIKTFKLIQKYDIDFLADLLIKVSHLALDYPQIKELDLNPIIVYNKGGKVIDVRMMI